MARTVVNTTGDIPAPAISITKSVEEIESMKIKLPFNETLNA